MAEKTTEFPHASTGVGEVIEPKGKASGNRAQLLQSNPTGCYAPTENVKEGVGL
jgi:hypothetical protein